MPFGNTAILACVKGPAGVGKTLSARHYARWDTAEALLLEWGPRDESDLKVYAALARSRAVFYTPTVGVTLRELRQDLPRLISRTDICIDQHVRQEGDSVSRRSPKNVELVIVDEAERFSMAALEYLRELFDREGGRLIVIGMPGIDMRLSRYLQLFNRVGFAHSYRPLQNEELTFALTRRWKQLGLGLDEANFTDAQAIAAIVHVTGGNFRLVHRLFVQIERVMRINGLNAVTEKWSKPLVLSSSSVPHSADNQREIPIKVTTIAWQCAFFAKMVSSLESRAWRDALSAEGVYFIFSHEGCSQNNGILMRIVTVVSRGRLTAHYSRLSCHCSRKRWRIETRPISVAVANAAPARNVPCGPTMSHKAPAMTLAKSSAKPVTRSNMPKAVPRSSGGAVL